MRRVLLHRVTVAVNEIKRNKIKNFDDYDTLHKSLLYSDFVITINISFGNCKPLIFVALRRPDSTREYEHDSCQEYVQRV